MDIHEMVLGCTEEVVRLRRDFHRHPELGFQEVRTARIVAEYLEGLGLEVQRGIAQTGVVGLLKGARPGRTLLLRADMDAIAVQELNEVPYRSENEGVMHACGHDGHTAILLVVAKILAGMRDRLHGNVKFVFQPNEENVAARRMIEEGVMENPRVDAAMALHLWTPIETGKVAVSEGPVMAGMVHFRVVIEGRGGHTAFPHTAIDPVVAAANVIQTSQLIQTREIDPLRPTLVVFGKVESGSASNVIPESAVLEGTIRTLSEEGIEPLQQRFERIVRRVCEAHRANCEIYFEGGHPPVVNHPEMTKLARQAAEETVGGANICSMICLAGEDFSEFGREVPAVLVFVGTGNERKGTNYPHHHPRFDIDEDSLSTGVEILLRAALSFLA
ncbi:M20 metallopeptidase family protein [Deferrisoma palaeochoriense]